MSLGDIGYYHIAFATELKYSMLLAFSRDFHSSAEKKMQDDRIFFLRISTNFRSSLNFGDIPGDTHPWYLSEIRWSSIYHFLSSSISRWQFDTPLCQASLRNVTPLFGFSNPQKSTLFFDFPLLFVAEKIISISPIFCNFSYKFSAVLALSN